MASLVCLLLWLVCPTASAAGARYHENRILIKPLPSRAGTLEAFHRSRQSRVLRTFPRQGNLQVIAISADDDVPGAVARYRSSRLVEFAEPDYVVTVALLPSDPGAQGGTQWWLNNYGQNGGLADADIDAPEAWDVRQSASNVIVAVVDTGIRLTHEDLAGNLWTNTIDGSHGFNALTGGHELSDENGHGTHLAGIIGAVGNNGIGISGIAWKVQIMSCKFLDASGNGYNSDAVSCIEFAQTNGARVINLSWGGPEYSDAVSNAIWSARADGIVVVAAAGNGSRNTDLEPFYPASLPLDNIVAVGASTRLDQVWNNSSFGSSTVDLFAPGAAMYSTWRTSDTAYGSSDGSSWAAGVVSGAFALLSGNFPTASHQELIQRMLTAVDQRAAFSGKCVTGGRLNIRRALDLPAIQMLSGDVPTELRISGFPGHEYSVETTSDFGAWNSSHVGTSDGEGEWRVTDFGSTNVSTRFYRAVPAP